MANMTKELYRVAVSLAGDHACGYLPHSYRLAHPEPHRLPARSKAIYIAVDRVGAIHYVGSVCRPRREGLRQRASEHVRDWFKQREWHAVWIVPLKAETPRETVLAIEGRIGRRLRPTHTKRLPRPSL